MNLKLKTTRQLQQLLDRLEAYLYSGVEIVDVDTVTDEIGFVVLEITSRQRSQ